MAAVFCFPRKESQMNSFFSDILARLPQDVDWIESARLFGLFFGASLILGCLIRIFTGKRSGANHAVSSAMGILTIYAVTIVVYTFNPVGMARFLTPLPFITISGDTLIISGFAGQSFRSICSEVLAMLMLAFLVNLLDSFIPKGKKWYGWYGYRFLTVLMAMVLHYVLHWLTTSFIPAALNAYAPIILLGILVLMLVLGASKAVLGVILVAVNPVIGAIYTFFFANVYGKQVTKAAFTTAILCALVYLLEYAGMTVVSIAAAMLASFIPLILILLVLWYLLGHVL